MSKLEIPKVEAIINEAIEEVLKRYNQSSIKDLLKVKSFSDVINEIEGEAERLYKIYEKKAVKKYLKNKKLADKNILEVMDRIIDNSLITSIANIRRSRAGSTSQQILIKILKEFEIPCQISKLSFKGYRPDITIPSDEIISKNPNKGFAIAVKRTLRERWAEDIDIFKFPNSAFVLIKPDPDFTPVKAEDMIKRGMKKVYIPDTIYEKYKNELKAFKDIFKRLSDLPIDIIEFLKLAKHKK